MDKLCLPLAGIYKADESCAVALPPPSVSVAYRTDCGFLRGSPAGWLAGRIWQELVFMLVTLHFRSARIQT